MNSDLSNSMQSVFQSVMGAGLSTNNSTQSQSPADTKTDETKSNDPLANMLATLAIPPGGGTGKMHITHNLGEVRVTHTIGDGGQVALWLICISVFALAVTNAYRVYKKK